MKNITSLDAKGTKFFRRKTLSSNSELNSLISSPTLLKTFSDIKDIKDIFCEDKYLKVTIYIFIQIIQLILCRTIRTQNEVFIIKACIIKLPYLIRLIQESPHLMDELSYNIANQLKYEVIESNKIIFEEGIYQPYLRRKF